MPIQIDLTKKLYKAQPYSYIADVRQAPEKITPKQEVTLLDILVDGLPTIELMAREYLFSTGKHEAYRGINDFLIYLKTRVNPSLDTTQTKEGSKQNI